GAAVTPRACDEPAEETSQMTSPTHDRSVSKWLRRSTTPDHPALRFQMDHHSSTRAIKADANRVAPGLKTFSRASLQCSALWLRRERWGRLGVEADELRGRPRAVRCEVHISTVEGRARVPRPAAHVDGEELPRRSRGERRGRVDARNDPGIERHE